MISGGLGFQGYHLARRWLGEGHDVTVLNTPSERAGTMWALLQGATGGRAGRVIWGSVTDPEIMSKALADQTHVVHLAAWTSVDQSFTQPRAVYRVNSEAMYVVLEAIRQINPRARVLVASSCEVYGNTGAHAADEDSPLRPHSPYAAAKAAGDRLAYAYGVTYGLNIAILRPCNVYGPWQKSGSAGAVIPTFLDAARRGNPLQITGDGTQRREFLYVVDLVRAYAALLDRETEPGATFNIGTGETASIEDLAQRIADRYGVKCEYNVRAARPGEVSNFNLNSTRFRALTGWSPSVPLDAGLDVTMRWANGETS